MAVDLRPALGMLELDSVAVGIAAGDAMVKRAPVDAILAGTVQPGKYLVLVAGQVADVEAALAAGIDSGSGHLFDQLFLPGVHPQVVALLRGARPEHAGEALGVVETRTVASVIRAADAGVKGANVVLLELRIGDGLGGKGYLLFGGAVSDVEAAVDVGAASIAGDTQVTTRVVAQLHPEMRANLAASGRFHRRIRTPGPGRIGAAEPLPLPATDGGAE
jgi:microcompartment protein CcmL/EutN